MKTESLPQLSLAEVKKAQKNLEGIAKNTPLEKNRSYSKDFDAQIFLKREDQQRVRSYKIRGAYHKIVSLTAEERAKGVVCASAGNHAQGVAYSCKKLNIDWFASAWDLESQNFLKQFFNNPLKYDLRKITQI